MHQGASRLLPRQCLLSFLFLLLNVKMYIFKRWRPTVRKLMVNRSKSQSVEGCFLCTMKIPNHKAIFKMQNKNVLHVEEKLKKFY